MQFNSMALSLYGGGPSLAGSSYLTFYSGQRSLYSSEVSVSYQNGLEIIKTLKGLLKSEASEATSDSHVTILHGKRVLFNPFASMSPLLQRSLSFISTFTSSLLT